MNNNLKKRADALEKAKTLGNAGDAFGQVKALQEYNALFDSLCQSSLSQFQPNFNIHDMDLVQKLGQNSIFQLQAMANGLNNILNPLIAQLQPVANEFNNAFNLFFARLEPVANELNNVLNPLFVELQTKISEIDFSWTKNLVIPPAMLQNMTTEWFDDLTKTLPEEHIENLKELLTKKKLFMTY